MYNDANQSVLQRLVQALRSVSATPLGIQLSHAGRKASCETPWRGGGVIPEERGGWRALAPSAVAYTPGAPAPQAMSHAQVRQTTDVFAQAARRARAIGFDAIELHMAHGYLLHQFLSPLSNRRTDGYGGSLDNRTRLPLEVFEAVLAAAGPGIAVGVRLSASDWVAGGWEPADATALARRLEAMGCAFLDISSGGLSPEQKIPLRPGYQVPFAAEVRRAARIPVVSVGLISEPAQAEDIVCRGDADLVALARGFLHDPRWPWRAAAELGATVPVPPQLLRALPAGHPAIFAAPEAG